MQEGKKDRATLVAEIRELTKNHNYIGIHRFLCHPWDTECSNMCRRQVSQRRLEIWSDVSAEQEDKLELQAVS